jgi:hypothetical protein
MIRFYCVTIICINLYAIKQILLINLYCIDWFDFTLTIYLLNNFNTAKQTDSIEANDEDYGEVNGQNQILTDEEDKLLLFTEKK